MIRRTSAALRNLVLRKRIPFRKPGGRLIFLLSEIESWVNESHGLTWEELKDRGNGDG
jgi:hypothetical protein